MALDKRLNLYRPDLADESLRGQVEAGRFAVGLPMQVGTGTASLRRQPALSAMQLTEALPGETLKVFDSVDDWSWIKLDRDGYVGHILTAALVPVQAAATHEVAVPSAFLYPKADLKAQPATILPMLARLAVSHTEKDYAGTQDGGFVFQRHLRPLGTAADDFVSVAQRFLHTPYCWGGKTVHGIDCSGLVQVSLHAAGRTCPRDSDMQEQALGTALPAGEKPRRGDLVFWDGHVGIMADAETLLHANGFDMMVVMEPLTDAVARSEAKAKPVTSMKRLQ